MDAFALPSLDGGSISKRIDVGLRGRREPQLRVELAKGDCQRFIWMAAYLEGVSRGEPRGGCMCYCSRVGASLLETHKQKTLSEGSPQLRSWTGSCSIGDEPSGWQLPN